MLEKHTFAYHATATTMTKRARNGGNSNNVLGPGTTHWVTLRNDIIDNLFRFFDGDVNVRTAYTIRMDALLAGNILFQKSETNKPRQEDDQTLWYNMVYGQFCRQVVRSLWSVGFCAASYVPDENYVGKPVVLNLEEVEIDYYNNAMNQPEWLYFEREKGTLGMADRKPMANIITFYLPDCLPNRNGNLRSFMTTLLPEVTYEQHLMQCDIMASTSRCNPPLVSEDVPENYNPNNLDPGLRGGSSRHGDGMLPAKPTAPTMELVDHSGSSLARQLEQRDTLAMLNAYNTSDINEIRAQMQKDFRRQFQAPNLPQFYLENKRHYVSHTLAEGPSELVLKAQLQRTERVLTLLGVPMSMITQSASMNGKRAINENSMTLFNNSQRMMKQQLISYMQTIYAFIYRRHHAMEALKKSDEDEDEKELQKRLKREADITISIPGLPSDADLDRFWMTGALKYNVYCDYISSKHGISRKSFHETQQLTPEDLNGIKEDEPALS